MMTSYYVFSSSLRDMLRLQRLAPWLVIPVLLFVLGRVWQAYISGYSDAQAYAQMSAILTFRVLALAAAVFATTVIAQEVEQKTIVYLLTRPVERWKLLLLRGAAALVATFLAAALAALAVSASVFGAKALGNPLFWSDLKALALGAGAYGGLFILISLFLNRAMIYCLLYAFGWELFVPNMPGDLLAVSIYSHLTAAAQHPAPPTGERNFADALAGALQANPLTPSTAVLVLVSVAVITLAFGAFWFGQFEYTPREDAE